MSPESLLGGLQGFESDLWSLGILLYEMHTDKEPFSGKSPAEMLQLISNGRIRFSPERFPAEAAELTQGLLKFTPEKRMRIAEIWKSAFVRKFKAFSWPMDGKSPERGNFRFAASKRRETRFANQKPKIAFYRMEAQI